MSTTDPTSAARERAAVLDVSDRGALEVAGNDAVAFLHNLCTNDIKSLSPGRGCEFFLTTHKARVVAHGWAHRLLTEKPPKLWLDVSPGYASKVLAHLDHFLVSEQVELADRTADRVQFHVVGPAARSVVEKALAGTLSELADLQEAGPTFGPAVWRVVRHDWLALPGYDLVCGREPAINLLNRLQQSGAVLLGQDAFELLRIEAGLPLDGVDMDDNRFVVEAGRTRQAVSYTKGCYLGQEPIVMARDRGHANRTLLGLKVAGTEAVVAGAMVMHNGQEAGQVTSSVWSPHWQAVLALAYLRRGSQEPGTAVEVGQCPAVVMALPFAPLAAESQRTQA